jgi:hypothetical protein
MEAGDQMDNSVMLASMLFWQTNLDRFPTFFMQFYVVFPYFLQWAMRIVIILSQLFLDCNTISILFGFCWLVYNFVLASYINENMKVLFFIMIPIFFPFCW